MRGKDVLIYKYIKYPYIFIDCLYSYIVKESSSMLITNDRSLGLDYLFVMESFIFNSEEHKKIDIKRISELFKHKMLNNHNRGIYPRNFVDVFKIILQGCPVFIQDNSIHKFIEFTRKGQLLDFAEKIVTMYNFYTDDSKNKGFNIIKDKIEKANLENYNVLNKIIFVTDDLDILINNIRKECNYDVNEGPQK
jgi:hypothetical protein